MANTRSYRNLPTRIALPTALVASVVASLIVELIIAAIAHGAGAYADFRPLTFGGLIGPTVLGLLIAVVAWELVRRRAADPVAAAIGVGLFSQLLPPRRRPDAPLGSRQPNGTAAGRNVIR
jgi:hypothetical protein